MAPNESASDVLDYYEWDVSLGEASNGSRPLESSSFELYEIPSFLVTLLVIIYMMVSLSAVIGNAMVLYIVLKSKQMRNITNIYIANLAASDIMIGALAIPFQFQAALLQKWILPYFMCSFCPTIQVISLNISIFTLIALSLDRHRAITQPLKPRTSKLRAKLIMISIWLLAFILAAPTFVAWEIQDMQAPGNGTETEAFCDASGISRELWRSYNHLLVALQYLFPLIVISLAYVHMAIELSRSTMAANSRSDPQRAMRSKRRVIKMLFIVVSLFAVCWLPFQMYNILQEIYPTINEYKYINIIWFSCHWLAMSNSCYNPFIYAIYGEKFNAEFRKRFNMCCFWAQCYNYPAAPRTEETTIAHSVCRARTIRMATFSEGDNNSFEAPLEKEDRREPTFNGTLNDT